MKTKSILSIAACLLVTSGFALAQCPEVGRCGQPRGTCDNVCNGQGGGGGQGGGARRGNGDGNGNGNGEQKRERKRDGSGEGCRKGTAAE